MAIPNGSAHSGGATSVTHGDHGGALYLDAADGALSLTLPDAALMFRGAFARSGPDLSITGPEGNSVVITNYFAHEHGPTLLSPEGAMLAPDLVAQLAGPRFPGVYAQQGPAAQAAPIGQVEATGGTATIVHADGSRTAAAVGTPVFQGDVVETGGDGRLSITFADKTNISLGEGARIVLDKFVYDPGSAGQNSLLFNLVQGAFVFVAGYVAPTGDMKIQTPVATMGIRGTTGVVRADVQDGTSYFTLKPDPPGKLGEPGGNVGAFDVFARLNGVLIKEVRVPDQLLVVRNAAGQFQDLPQIGSNEAAFQQEILNFAFASHQQMLLRTDNGQSPVDGQPGPPNPNNRGDVPGDVQHAGLTPGGDKPVFFHDPLSVDLIKQTDPLGNEEGKGGTQTGDTSTNGASQSALVLAPPPAFTSQPIAVAFFQQPDVPGIHATLPYGFTSSANLPVSVKSTVVTVSAVSFPVGDAPAQPFTLTPEQTQAFTKAFNAETGHFDLAIDTSFLAEGQQVVVTVTVTIQDSRGVTATQTEAFSIVGTNDAPTLAPTQIHLQDTAAADTFQPVTGALEGHDADNGAHLTYAIAGATSYEGVTRTTTAYGTLTVLADGSYTFTPNSAAINALGDGAHVSLPIAITVSDGIAAPVQSTLTINIDGANDAPTLDAVKIHFQDTSAPDTFQPVTGTLQGHDADANAHLTYAIAGETSYEGTTRTTTAYGELTVLSDGSYTFTPNSAAINALGEGAHISVPITVTVSDGIAAPVQSTLTIEIDGVNDVPVITAGHGSVTPLTYTGSADLVGDNTLALTTHPESGGYAGAIWQAVDLSQNAQWTVKLYFGPGGGFEGLKSADGIAFAFQAQGNAALGGGGGGMGVDGIPGAIGVKFDTYPFNPGDGESDIANNFAKFFAQGDISGAGFDATKQLLPLLSDGQYHDVHIDWNATTHTLTYSIDGYTGSLQRDIVGLDFGGNSLVYAGFTGGGGAAHALEAIQLESTSNGTSGLIAERPYTSNSSELRVVSGSFTFSDAEVGDGHTLSVVPPQGDTYGSFQATLVSDGAGHGTVNWTYTVQEAALDPLKDNDIVKETFKIVIGDGRGTSSQDVDITLSGATHEGESEDFASPPVIVADDQPLSQAIVGSSGDEVIALTLNSGDSFVQQVDGRGGTNALHLLGNLETVDLTQLASGQLQNIQEIDLTQGTAQTLKLSLDQVLQLNTSADANLLQAVADYNSAQPADKQIAVSQNHLLVVDGDHGAGEVAVSDTLSIVDATANAQSGSWVYAGTVTSATLSAGASEHDIYNYVTPAHEVLASIAVQHDVQVHLPNHNSA
ncbi:MAG: hypothetical protein EKK41_13795 [Hyphomicrobiales bacterium]|nr:MAG: hypothetical protein EKK41_13795 [Hyphomicrobiales bacterium]